MSLIWLAGGISIFGIVFSIGCYIYLKCIGEGDNIF